MPHSIWNVYFELLLRWEKWPFFLYYCQGIEKPINYSFHCGGECSKRLLSRSLKCSILRAWNKQAVFWNWTWFWGFFCSYIPRINKKKKKQRSKFHKPINGECLWIFSLSNTSTMTVRQQSHHTLHMFDIQGRSAPPRWPWIMKRVFLCARKFEALIVEGFEGLIFCVETNKQNNSNNVNALY